MVRDVTIRALVLVLWPVLELLRHDRGQPAWRHDGGGVRRTTS